MYGMFFMCFSFWVVQFRVWYSYKKPLKTLKTYKKHKYLKLFWKPIVFSSPGSTQAEAPKARTVTVQGVEMKISFVHEQCGFPLDFFSDFDEKMLQRDAIYEATGAI